MDIRNLSMQDLHKLDGSFYKDSMGSMFVDIEEAIHRNEPESQSFFRELFRHLHNPVFTALPLQVPAHLKKDEIIAYYPAKQFIYMGHDLPHIGHEVAHMVEMNNLSRIFLPDWGMKAFNNEGKPSSKELFAAMARETRVRAIVNVLEGKGFQPFNNHSTWHNSLLKGHLPFGRFKDVKEVKQWCSDMGLSTYNAWSKERVHHEWMRRVELIRNWQETVDGSNGAMQAAA